MSLRHSLLWPLTVLYAAGTRVRSFAYDKGLLAQRRLGSRVISVGNLTVGGTGKTPMVLWIARRLLAEGRNVAILTRGYRGKPAARGGREARGASTSDEVQLLRSRLGDRILMGVGADRFANGEKLVADGVDWFVLDDGFQHRRLARDVDIVLVDATNPFGGGALLPSGRLREPRSALSRADMVVITRSDHAPAIEGAVRHDSKAPIFYAEPMLQSVWIRSDDLSCTTVDREYACGQKLFAFCGIGNPSAFLADLKAWGFQVVGHKFFRDHHAYTRQDVEMMEKQAREAGAADLICTEKDIFNLGDLRLSAGRIFYCSIELRIERETEFWNAMITRAQSGAGNSR